VYACVDINNFYSKDDDSYYNETILETLLLLDNS